MARSRASLVGVRGPAGHAHVPGTPNERLSRQIRGLAGHARLSCTPGAHDFDRKASPSRGSYAAGVQRDAREHATAPIRRHRRKSSADGVQRPPCRHGISTRDLSETVAVRTIEPYVGAGGRATVQTDSLPSEEDWKTCWTSSRPSSA
jgi:hypothetical protein